MFLKHVEIPEKISRDLADSEDPSLRNGASHGFSCIQIHFSPKVLPSLLNVPFLSGSIFWVPTIFHSFPEQIHLEHNHLHFLSYRTKLNPLDVALIREYFPAAPSSHLELWTQWCCSCRKPVSTQLSGGLHLFSYHWLCSDFTAHSASHLIQGKSNRVPDPALDLPSKSLSSKMTPQLRPEALESDLYEFKRLFYLKKIS